MIKRVHSAFVMPISPRTTAMLIGRRSKKVNHAGKWDFFGGRLKKGEKPVKGARREFIEETGIFPTNLGPHVIVRLEKRVLHIFPFYQLTENGLKIYLNDEHDKYMWVKNAEDLDDKIELTKTARIILFGASKALSEFAETMQNMEWDLKTKIIVNVHVK